MANNLELLDEANSLGLLDEIIKAIGFYAHNDKSTRDTVLGVTRAAATSNVSIATRSKLNICQFPLLVSGSIGVDTYQKVSQILEQLYAQYLKLVIVNQLEVVNLEKGDNKLSVISKVHQNDDALSTYIDRTRDEILKADISSRFESAIPFLECYNFSRKQLTNASRALLKPYNENFSLNSLNGNSILKEESVDEIIDSKTEHLKNLIESRDRITKIIDQAMEKADKVGLTPAEQKRLNQLIAQRQEIEEEIEYVNKIFRSLMGKKTLDEREREKSELALKHDFRKKFGSVSDFENTLIKKNNSLEPTIITFGLKYHTKGGSFEDARIAVGVKTVTHLIDSDEMCHYINETLTKKKFSFKAIQVLTGEKTFGQAFLSFLDKAKKDVKNDSTTAKWWRHLQDRRTASWIRAFRHERPYVPNATIVLSQEDYAILKQIYKKDILKDVRLAYQLTDLLFLMHLVIVDDVSNQIILFNKDSRNWETYTLDKLQNEINTMNKMSNGR